ncbi:MAG TPA: ABC transporter permease, partial [Treponemataceae bacterium]|nr:ABC transporter permease [Treponemataceae bacterium]
CISLLSRYIFNTTSIIPLPAMMGSKTIYSSGVLLATIGWTISIVVLAILQKTSWGIHIRITGRDPEVLEDRGLNPHHYKHASWSIAAALATIAGCIYVFNLSAFVPNISSGRGWVALTAVFVGRKKGWGTILVLLVFAITDYIATAIQGIATVHIPPTIFLSVPYIAALILFVFQPKKSTRMY